MKLERFTLLCVFCIFTIVLLGQRNTVVQYGASKGKLLGTSRPLSSIPTHYIPNAHSIKKNSKKHKPGKDFYYQKSNSNAEVIFPVFGWPDPLIESSNFNTTFSTDPFLNIEGINQIEADMANVPDPVGDVGPDHYVQMTNAAAGSLLTVYDKAGNLMYGPTNTNGIWSEVNAFGIGDPIILYDQHAERWILTELAPFETKTLLIAVSITSNPLDGWYIYAIVSPFNTDYPKYGVWPNAYVVTTNDQNSSCIPVFALDKQAMINGEEDINLLSFGLPKFASSINATFQVAAPVDWDGHKMPAPEAQHGYVMRMYDNIWEGGEDALEMYRMNIDWNFPELSTLEGPEMIYPSTFDSYVCEENDLFDCVDQLGNANTFSALQQTLMHRIQYRNFNNHESIVLNHVVDVDGNDQAGIRWYELRKTIGTDWTVFQEGTLTGENGDHLFMASIAMDGNGNIGLGYNISGPDRYPSAQFTGRLANDPLNQMTMAPFEFATGESSNLSDRWGDYSSMNIDPENDLAFWYTTEYMDSFSNWKTKIVAFQMDQFQKDLAVFNIINPVSGPNLSDSTIISAQICNQGLDSINTFKISYQIDGGEVITEFIDTLILPDSCYVHHFDSTANLSMIGSYDLSVFGFTELDNYSANDTFSTTIVNQTINDAGIIWINNLNNYVCDSIHPIAGVVKNYGQDTLFSVDVIVLLNGELQATESLNAISVPPGACQNILLEISGFVQGLNEITAYTEMPNASEDQDSSNDTFQQDINWIAGNSSVIRINFLTDADPFQNNWSLQTEEGTLLYESDVFTEPFTTYIKELCLPNACYQFVLNDKYGNGIESEMLGDYTILGEGSGVITGLINPAFGAQEVNSFCLSEDCMLTASATIANTSAPGAMDASVFLSPENGNPPFTYIVNNVESTNPLFENLPAGNYTIIVSDLDSCTYQIDTTIIDCDLQAITTITNAIEGIGNDGSILIEMTNGQPPYLYSLNNAPPIDQNLFENLTPGFYDVMVIDALGCQYFANQLLIDEVTSIEFVQTGYDIQLYPNPSQGIFSLEINGLSGETILPFRIIDVNGKVLRHDKIARFNQTYRSTVSLIAYPPGIYYLSFDTNDFKQLIRVVKL